MTNAQFLDLIMARLGGRTSPTLRATLVNELNIKIRQLERGAFKPWFLQSEATEADAALVPNQQYIALPADFLMEIEEADFRMYDTDLVAFKPLVKVDYRRLNQETENVDAGIPEGYALFGKRIYFGPKPSTALAYKFPYYRKTAAVADNASEISNDWLLEFPNYILLETVFLMASEHTQSSDVMNKTTPELKVAKSDFQREVEAMTHSNQAYLLDEEEN